MELAAPSRSDDYPHGTRGSQSAAWIIASRNICDDPIVIPTAMTRSRGPSVLGGGGGGGSGGSGRTWLKPVTTLLQHLPHSGRPLDNVPSASSPNSCFFSRERCTPDGVLSFARRRPSVWAHNPYRPVESTVRHSCSLPPDSAGMRQARPHAYPYEVGEDISLGMGHDNDTAYVMHHDPGVDAAELPSPTKRHQPEPPYRHGARGMVPIGERFPAERPSHELVAGTTSTSCRGESAYDPMPTGGRDKVAMIGRMPHMHGLGQKDPDTCATKGCTKRPTHGVRSGTPQMCPGHRDRGMVDLTKRNRCRRPGCSKQPRYAMPGQRAEYCSQHKLEHCVDVKHPRCEHEGGCIRQPTFGWEGEKARFCSAHKVEGMLDVKNPRCAHNSCTKRPRYGEEGERARYCAAHKLKDMVDLTARKANKCNSPMKRTRDGPQPFEMEHADGKLDGAPHSAAKSTHRSSIAITPRRKASHHKRGHTPAEAGGHRRCVSESLIDFCPKHLYGSTVLGDDEIVEAEMAREERGSVRPAIEQVKRADMKSAYHGSSTGVGDTRPQFVFVGRSPEDDDNPPTRRDDMNGTDRRNMGNKASAGTLESESNLTRAAAPASPISSPSVTSSESARRSFPPGRKSPDQLPNKMQPRAGNRFDAMDYEASAILLECRSGALLPYNGV